MKKLLAMSITLALVASMFSACGDNAANSSQGSSSPSGSSSGGSSSQAASSGTEAVGITYPLEGKPKLSIVTTQSTYVLNSYTAWQDTPFIEAWAEQTGVDLEASFVSDFSVYLASGDYADIINYSWNNYSGGLSKAIDDGIIIDIADYVEKFAPDYWKVMNEIPQRKKNITTPSGEIPGFSGFYKMGPDTSPAMYGCFIRGDWLDDLSLEVPKTPDQLVNVLKAFRDEKGAAVPMTLTLLDLGLLGSQGMFTSPFGLVNTDYYQVEGKIHFGAYEESYKDYITFLNRLYAEELIDKNVLTVDWNTTQANMLNGVSGIGAGFATGEMKNLVLQATSSDPGYNLVGMGSLVQSEGDRAMFHWFTGYASGACSAITTSCKDVETAVKFLNYGYTEAGQRLMCYGVEGITFNMIDGAPYYTDYVKNNPDGLNFNQALSPYAFHPAGGPYVADDGYLKQVASDAQLSAKKLWADTDAEKYYVPTSRISVADKYLSDYTAIKSEIDTCVSEYFAKFVTGEYPIEEKWDEYISTLKSMGIDTMIQYYQEAYDVYQSW